ncbi:MAG: DUF2252 family protein [Myxococcaceae bacterium]
MSLASVQLQADLRRLGRNTALLRRKWSRMTASPFSFLRGASALWAELLERNPKLLQGLPGAGVLVGDLHLENVGTFRTARGVALHVNDFDESFVGAWSFDVTRLLVSTLLARPELGVTGLEVVSLTEEVLDGHAAGLSGASPRLPPPLAGLVEAAEAKHDAKFIAKRLASSQTLVRDERMPPAPSVVVRQAKAAVEEWARATKQREDVTLLDVTRRVAGTGSLGVERLVALVRVGEEERLLEMKEVRGSSFSEGPPDPLKLLEAMLTCLPRPPLEVAACALGQLPVIVRPWFAADEKLSVKDLDRTSLPQTLRAIGVLAGEVHRRGATVKTQWTRAHRRQLLDAAYELAGHHEQVFHQFCRDVHEAKRGL